MNEKLLKEVPREIDRSRKTCIILLAIVILVMFVCGFTLNLLCFIIAVVAIFITYYLYYSSHVVYEYVLSGNVLTVSSQIGKRQKNRKMRLQVRMDDVKVVAPNRHDAVAEYRMDGGGVKLKKYDFTSQDDRVPYHTMIVKSGNQLVKVLLDLDDDWLQQLTYLCPNHVYR